MGCHFLLPGDLPGPGIEPVSPVLAGSFFTAEPPGKELFITAEVQLSLQVVVPWVVDSLNFLFICFAYYEVTGIHLVCRFHTSVCKPQEVKGEKSIITHIYIHNTDQFYL